MKIAHISDLHFCQKYLEEVVKCADFAIDKAIEARCVCAVLSGDLFDHRVDLHAPTVAAAVKAVKRLADAMPVLLLQGTLLHDPAGCLEVFKALGAKFPIFVADNMCRVTLNKSFENLEYFWAPPDFTNTKDSKEVVALFSCLPSINKGELAASLGQEYSPEAVGENTAQLLGYWAEGNADYQNEGIPTIVVSHGTVSGSVTEHGCPMVGLDHEFTTGSLFAAGANAVMLGHIHKHQAWERDISGGFFDMIAYAGSIGRLHFGEMDPKGFLIWEVEYDRASFEFVTTPAKELVDIEFEGAPDMAALGEAAADCAGKHVRIRYVLDEEHRNIVDQDLIKSLFDDANELKIEPRILPIQRTRSAGISHKPQVSEKLDAWCGVTETEPAPLQERLQSLQQDNVECIMSDMERMLREIAKSPLFDTNQ